MKSSVIVFPGSNCDRDVAVALEKFQIKNQMVWHDEANLPESDLVILPGGFSYGDYLRTGCIASKSRIINEVIKHAKKGGLILGICNGFQILIETGLLPGVLLRNKKLRFLSKSVFCWRLRRPNTARASALRNSFLKPDINFGAPKYPCNSTNGARGARNTSTMREK